MSEPELWEKIKEARLNAGYTQGQLAKLCGVTRATASRWESEDPEVRRGPRVDHLRKIADITGKEIKFFMPNLKANFLAARDKILQEEEDIQLQQKVRVLAKEFMDLILDGSLSEKEVDMLYSLITSLRSN
ncbi:helix-turn-helix transcriptional regulator [Zooshikella ganghwensis]|uniref:helix-turn-helix transcriptional regulator n=1 Tax=Zooshikella ganghwensis TaxID=202772 RepID=UPI000482254D|nr:helix-turn-helix transcriptional regulator [Zooshikella ganghwensis]